MTAETSPTTRVRIAPSPTGDPHVGTAYIGLLNYIFAAQRDGQFVLRIEDTDRARFVATSEQMIFDALKWIGLSWHEGPDVGGPYGPYRQSERTEIYRQHADILLANASAYRCFCTPEDLEAARERQKAAKQPPRYDGTCRRLTPEQVDTNLTAGKTFVVRMAVPLDGATTFRDELRGDITFDHNNVDDQVLMKSDGFPTYHLANVVDDHLMRITDVIRAEEWISSTPKHVLLYKAFGWESPRFWHMPLLRNVDKSKISKRKNPVSLVYYRESGYLPNALLNFLGLMGGGMAQPTEQEIVSKNLNTKEGDIFSLAEMLEKFDFKRISLGGPVFDLVKLKWLNGEYIRKLSPEDFFAALRQTVLSDDYLRAIAHLVQTRVETLGQFGDMTGFFFSDNVMPPESVFLPKKRTLEETLTFVADQLAALEAAPWTATSIEAELKKLGEEKQWSVKENFMLLRAIVTGSANSPPLVESLVVFGKARTLDRMRRFLE
ncbi:MAG: glutamate--tRNA ligase, partial [Acidobacteriota bacterium]|nr:glutamate--tRNA ligase [Acidobacteriota bacterium]